MNICKNCKHFEPYKDDFHKEKYPHSGECSCEKFVYDENPDIDGMEYWDYEGYSAGFRVGEQFGCVHFVERSPK